MAAEAKAVLRRAALRVVRERGIAGTSARAIADAAGISQGLIFYHYGSITGLLEAAATEVAQERASVYRERLSEVGSLTELADLARQLHDEERDLGNVAVMAQLLAGAHTHPELGPVARANFELLAAEVGAALDRLLAETALGAALPPRELAHAISATFIGIELLQHDGGGEGPELFDTLAELARLVDTVLDLGPPGPQPCAGA